MKRIYGILLLIFLLLLTGCENNEKAQYYIQKEDAVADGTVTLEVFAWEDEEENLRILSEAFMKENADISINMNILPVSEYSQQMMGIKKGMQTGDVVLFSNISEPVVWIEKDVLQDLAPWLENTEECYETWYQGEDEKYISYMRPYRKSKWAVYYNKDLFDQRGIPYPQSGWTWSDYAQTAERLTGQVGLNRIYGSLSYAPDNKWWRVPARTAGANNPLNEKELQLFMEAAKWCYELTYDLKAQVPYKDRTGNSGISGEEIFLEGNTGMFFSGDWSAAILNELILEKKLDISYDIAPMPRWEEEPFYSISDAAVVAMTASTAHKDEAYAFIQFIAGAEGAALLAQRGYIPAWNSEEIRKLYLDSMTQPEHLEYFFVEGEVSSVPANMGYAEAIDIMEDEIAFYLLQEQDLQKCMDNIRAALKFPDTQECNTQECNTQECMDE